MAHIRAEAKTAPIVANQSTANWYNCRDRRRETTDLSVEQRRTHKTEGEEGALRTQSTRGHPINYCDSKRMCNKILLMVNVALQFMIPDF